MAKEHIDQNVFFSHYSKQLLDYVRANLATISLPNTFYQYPALKFMPVLSIISNNEMIAFLRNKDVMGFYDRLKSIINNELYIEAITQVYSVSHKQELKEIYLSFARLFYETEVDKLDFTSSEFMQIKKKTHDFFETLDKLVYKFDGYKAFKFDKSLFNDTLDKRLAVLFASGALNIAEYPYSIDTLLDNTFGANSTPKENKFIIFSDKFDKAKSFQKVYYNLLVNNGKASIMADITQQWFESLAILSDTKSFQSPINKSKPNISSSTKEQAAIVYKQLSELSKEDITRSVSYFVKVGNTAIDTADDKDWFIKSFNIMSKLIEDKKIDDSSSFAGLLFNDLTFSAFSKQIEKSKFLLSVVEAFETMDIKPFVNPGKNRSINTVFSFLNWMTDLQNDKTISVTDTVLFTLAFQAGTTNKNQKYVDMRSLEHFQWFSDSIYCEAMDDYSRGWLTWLLANNVAMRQHVISHIEDKRNPINEYNSYSIEFITDEYVTPKLIERLHYFWETDKIDNIFDEMKKYKSSKLKSEFISFLLKFDKTDKNYKYYRTMLMSFATAADFKRIIAELNETKNINETFLNANGYLENNISSMLLALNNNVDLIKNIDENSFAKFMSLIKSIDKYQQHDLNTLLEFSRRVIAYDEQKLNAVLTELAATKDKIGKRKIVSYIFGSYFGKNANSIIFKDDEKIKPYNNLDDNRLGEILKYNNISINNVDIDNIQTIDDINKIAINLSKQIEKIKIKEVDSDEEYLELKTVEYDAFNKYRHGNIAPRILREFDVHIPKQISAFNSFVDKNTNTQILDPVFHGTGSIAASMILRYGFTIIKQGDPIVTGRMIGDGIYFSNVIDKVSQYISDGGYSRGIGNKGYILQMKAALGYKGRDYKSEGVDPGSVNKLVSPEWCVFQPDKQLQIYKAFEVELVDKTMIDKLKLKHSIKESVVELTTFTDFLREAKQPSYTQSTTFTFIDGNIPINNKEVIDFTEFKPSKFGKHVRLSVSGLGPMLTIEHNEPMSKAFCVRFTDEFMKEPEFNYFISLLQGKLANEL